MAQLRQEHEDFRALDTEVLVIVPNGPRSIAKYVEECRPPYRVLSDKGSVVAEEYGIGTRRTRLPFLSSLMKPTVFLVGKDGRVCYCDYTESYVREPDSEQPMELLRCMAGPSAGEE